MVTVESRVPPGRLLGALCLTLVFVTSPEPYGLAGPAAAASSAAEQKVEAEVLSEMQDAGKSTYWVVLKARADLRPAHAMKDQARGRFVVDQLRAVAERSQASLRALLRGRGGDFTPFWAANVVKVTSDKPLLEEIAALPEVERVEADRVYRIPDPIPGVAEAAIQAVEWNIANIRANEVWSTFGSRGEGIVVGSIDTGAQFNHPALVNQYRGSLGGGVYDHNYNWFDPSNICGSPSLVPCDNNNHGTHTMGTIVGDDGGANQIGVAPGARWITAKGCESSSCTTTALVAAGQWMLAPTDLNGANPRPDLRPDLVSNSWGDGPGNTFYQQIVQSWVAAGIFPVFANGNSGPTCGSVGSPGDYPESYGVGAYDSANLIASFSSRGASALGGTKPNISAPGVNVRSSIPGNGYAAFSGTSMATPHVAGVVALMWSAAPSLVGDIANTRTILDQTAIDTADNSCGGSAANNNVYGEGRMDAFAAVDQSPRGPTGVLQGTVTDSSTAAPLIGARVRVTGPSNRTTTSGADGRYTFTLPVGTYDVEASGFGYLTQAVTGVAVTVGATTTRDIDLVPAPSHALSGVVRDTEGNPVAHATVTILATPLEPAVTDATGAYVFPSVPEGTYDVNAQAGRCNDPQTQSVPLTADLPLDFALLPRMDAFGYSCRIVSPTWVDGVTVLPLSGDDAYAPVSLPFVFEFYGGRYSSAYVSTNGFLTFATPSAAYNNTAIPSTYDPNAAVYAFWDDLYVDPASSAVLTQSLQAPNRFVVEWLNVAVLNDASQRLDVEVVLYESGEILVQYSNINPASGRERGDSATIGIENAVGTIAFQYGNNEPVVSEGLAVRYAMAPFTGVEGRVTDANDGLGVQGAAIRALQGGNQVAAPTSDASGYYRLHLPAGSYTIEASKSNYGTQSASVTVTEGNHVARDFPLQTGRLVVTPAYLSFTMNVGQQQTQVLTVSNTGSLPLHWQLAESGSVPWLDETPTSGTLAAGASQQVQVTVNAAGLNGSYSAVLSFTSDAGKQASAQLSVSAYVTAYTQRVNAGGPGAYDGSYYYYWSPDQAWVTGTWGFSNTRSTTVSTKKTIAGTVDQALFQDQRQDPGEYRFDNLPSGTYQVTLYFAELKQVKKGARVFNVTTEGVARLSDYDIMATKGAFTADTKTFTVSVTDGQLNLGFVARPRLQPPVVNAISVVQLQ